MSALLLRAFRTTLVKGGIGRTAVWKGEHRHAQRLHNRGLICYWRDPGLGNAITLTWRGMKVAYRLHRLHRRRP